MKEVISIDLSSRLTLSYYNKIAVINEAHRVDLVQHRQTGKICVLKHTDICSTRVLQILKDARLPGIPGIIDYFEENGSVTILEEYISGRPLSEVLETGQFNEVDAVRYLTGLCSILNLLHCLPEPIIHRDIKPSNIIIDSNGHPNLLDFNAAKCYNPSEAKDTILLGTQGYAAPEQYGFASSSPQTDIYAIGVLMKEMLQVLEIEDPYYQRIITRCTEIDPRDRFSSMTDLKEAILAAANGQIIPLESQRSFLPLGFRSRSPVKMLIAAVSYFVILTFVLTMDIPDVSGPEQWMVRLLILAIMLSLTAIGTNYGNIRRYFPLCCSQNPFKRYIGIALMSIIFCCVLFAADILIAYLLFP